MSGDPFDVITRIGRRIERKLGRGKLFRHRWTEITDVQRSWPDFPMGAIVFTSQALAKLRPPRCGPGDPPSRKL
jgi:hypothetical protein